MEDDLTPDYPASEFDRYATASQHETFDKLHRTNWVVSHLWEPAKKKIYIWVIKRDASSQGFIDTQGKFNLYKEKTNA